MANLIEAEKSTKGPTFTDTRSRPEKGREQHSQTLGPDSTARNGDESSATSASTTAPLVVGSNLARFTSITQRDGRQQFDAPPALPFDLRHHKVSIGIFSFLALSECCFVPIALYYGLSKGTTMRSGIYFAIITSLFGFVSGYEFGIRGWRLLMAHDTYRPLYGSQRFWGFDCTQYVLLTPFTVMTIILIIFSIPHHPSVKALALPMPVGMINTGVMFVVNGWAAQRGWRLMHFRLSSHVKNSVCPPLTFCMLEDICAVDGKGGKRYRQAAMARYTASPRFRALMLQLLWFWSIPAIVLGAGFIAIIYSFSDDVAYGVGWGAPTVWICLWTWATVLWTQRALRVEKQMWHSERNGTV